MSKVVKKVTNVIKKPIREINNAGLRLVTLGASKKYEKSEIKKKAKSDAAKALTAEEAKQAAEDAKKVAEEKAANDKLLTAKQAVASRERPGLTGLENLARKPLDYFTKPKNTTSLLSQVRDAAVAGRVKLDGGTTLQSLLNRTAGEGATLNVDADKTSSLNPVTQQTIGTAVAAQQKVTDPATTPAQPTSVMTKKRQLIKSGLLGAFGALRNIKGGATAKRGLAGMLGRAISIRGGKGLFR